MPVDRRYRRDGITPGFEALPYRASFVLVIILAAGLFLFSRPGAPYLEAVLRAIDPALGTVQAAGVSVTGWVSDAGAWAGGILTLKAENQRLREENARLLQWRDRALALEGRLRAYEGLMRAAPEVEPGDVKARVIGASGGPFKHTLLINAGAASGILPSQAVVTEEGLIGRIVRVGPSTSRVLLLRDINSRVPVQADQSGVRAILAGGEGLRPRLEFQQGFERAAPGERVVTSGDDGLMPPGLPVGFVAPDGGGTVVPFARSDRVDFVRVLTFDRRDDGAEAPLPLDAIQLPDGSEAPAPGEAVAEGAAQDGQAGDPDGADRPPAP